MFGIKKSLNVSVAGGIILYHLINDKLEEPLKKQLREEADINVVCSKSKNN